MKKLMILGLTAISMFTWANNSLATSLVSNTVKPNAQIKIFDVSGKDNKLIEGTKLSRSKPRQVCIAVNNVEPLESNVFAQFIVAPGKIAIHNKEESVKIETTDGGKEHLIIVNLPKSFVVNGSVLQCLRLEQTDPIGLYKVDVQFNGFVAKGLTFEVLK